VGDVTYSDPTKQERRPGCEPKAALRNEWADVCYLAMRYVRSPAAFFDDSIVSPPLLPRMLTNPRTRGHFIGALEPFF